MDPITIGLLALSAAGLGFNVFSQHSANKSNERMTRETNAMNYKIFQETMQYNSPRNMVQMYRDAGLNPLLTAGNLANVAKMNPVSLNAPHVDPLSADTTGLQQALSTQADRNLTNQQAINLEIDNQFKAKREQESINKTMSEADRNRNGVIYDQNLLALKQREMDMKGISLDLDIANTVSSLRLQAQDLKNKELDAQLKQVQLDYNKIDLSFKSAKSQAELEKINAEVQKTLKSIDLMKIQINSEAIKTGLLGLQQNLALRTQQANEDLLKAKARNEQAVPLWKGFDAITKMGTVFTPKMK